MERRPAPTFRPNLKLSHFIYKGPDKRDYSTIYERVKAEAEGRVKPRSGD